MNQGTPIRPDRLHNRATAPPLYERVEEMDEFNESGTDHHIQNETRILDETRVNQITPQIKLRQSRRTRGLPPRPEHSKNFIDKANRRRSRMGAVSASNREQSIYEEAIINVNQAQYEVPVEDRGTSRREILETYPDTLEDGESLPTFQVNIPKRSDDLISYILRIREEYRDHVNYYSNGDETVVPEIAPVLRVIIRNLKKYMIVSAKPGLLELDRQSTDFNDFLRKIQALYLTKPKALSELEGMVFEPENGETVYEFTNRLKCRIDYVFGRQSNSDLYVKYLSKALRTDHSAQEFFNNRYLYKPNSSIPLNQVISELQELDYSVMICNDGSSDQTGKIAKKMGAIVEGFEADMLFWELGSIEEIPYWMGSDRILNVMKNGNLLE